MSKAKAGDIEICYEIAGEGKPLVMIMGLTANMDRWAPELIDELVKNFRVLIFDNRGSGRTKAPPGGFSIGQFANDSSQLHGQISTED
ncbi:MAG: alpha/beta hydrolase [Actinomycetota bacterium]|nr:alpha/beta hydrolase [Actinomycetota bacterium]